MAEVTYIIPIVEYNDAVKPFLKRAIKSAEAIDGSKNFVLVGPTEVVDKAKVEFESEVDVVYNDEKTDFCSQVNKAAFFCKTPYFSILEFDDVFYHYWQKEALRYAKSDVSVLLPIEELAEGNEPDKLMFHGFANEIAWNAAFSNEEKHELGYVDTDELEGYLDFSLSGALIKTEDFISFGGLKPSLKIAACYEFLLRVCHNSKAIYVVPKVGYSHTIGRLDSYTEVAAKEISPEEGKWLIDTAKQEYFFKEDRNKTFENKA